MVKTAVPLLLAVVLVSITLAGPAAQNPSDTTPVPVSMDLDRVAGPPESVLTAPVAQVRHSWNITLTLNDHDAGDPVAKLCALPEAPRPGRVVVRVVAPTETHIDLSILDGVLERYMPSAWLTPPQQVESFQAAWRQAGPGDTVLIFTGAELRDGDAVYAGYACNGRGLVNTELGFFPGCEWAVALHELGHAWGYEHSETGVMRSPPLPCSEARRGFVA